MPDQEYEGEQNEEQEEHFVRLKREDIRGLEARAKKNEDLESSNQLMAKQLAFLRAGVDIDTPVGKLLFRGYDGELDAEAIKAEAIEVGALKGEPKEQEQELPADEQNSTNERNQLGEGAPADQFRMEDPDPKAEALKVGEAALARGASEEVALGSYFEHIARSVEKGDKRALWDPLENQ